MQDVVEYLTSELEGRVSKVNISARLTDSPCILVTSQMGWSANMQRIMKSQPMGDTKEMDYMKGDKILEINPDNAVRPRAQTTVVPSVSLCSAFCVCHTGRGHCRGFLCVLDMRHVCYTVEWPCSRLRDHFS